MVELIMVVVRWYLLGCFLQRRSVIRRLEFMIDFTHQAAVPVWTVVAHGFFPGYRLHVEPQKRRGLNSSMDLDLVIGG